MYSKNLQAAGLQNVIGGKEYNFRNTQSNIAVENDLLKLTHLVMNQPKGIVYANQVHGNQVTYVTSSRSDKFVQAIPSCDGLMTDEAGLALVIKFADCTPLVMFDPIKKVQTTVHSGWRGTVQEISVRAIEQMQAQFQSQLSDLLVFIGPTIDQSHYEVGPEVYQAFKKIGNRERYFRPGSQPGKYFLNMLEVNLYILEKAGIKEKQIECCDEFTYPSKHLHSARRDQPDYGLNAMVTVIEDE